MRHTLLLLPILCAACAGSAPAPQPAVVTTAHAAHPAPLTQPTVVDRNVARDPACHVIRALDGRAICADRAPLRVANRAAANAPTEPAFPVTGDSVFLVIGSFENAANARRWAAFNDEFGTDIHVARPAPGDRTMHRVLVGPLDPDNAPLLREILASAGVDESWRLGPCARRGDDDAAATANCSVLESPALAANTAPAAD